MPCSVSVSIASSEKDIVHEMLTPHMRCIAYTIFMTGLQLKGMLRQAALNKTQSELRIS